MIRVKICGITNLDDAQAAVAAGADLIGFVFYPPSPRYVTPETAREILAGLGAWRSQVRAVGVFVNELPGQVRTVMRAAGLDLAQLHGQESPAMVEQVGTCAYKALQARDLDTARRLVAHYHAIGSGRVPAVIADAPPAQLPGGNGMVADWTVAREIAATFPTLLAGGLMPENVRAAIATVRPWGVDVSSGVERAPGRKDHARMREFITQARRQE